MSDPFDAFAVHCGLRVESELLYVAPRDVLQPPSESDQYHLVILSGSTAASPVRLVFQTSLSDPNAPRMRDVLWWLAGDVWAIEHAEHALAPWAAHHGYPPNDPATIRLFEMHRRQAVALAELLGTADYRNFLALYDVQVAPTSRR